MLFQSVWDIFSIIKVSKYYGTSYDSHYIYFLIHKTFTDLKYIFFFLIFSISVIFSVTKTFHEPYYLFKSILQL